MSQVQFGSLELAALIAYGEAHFAGFALVTLNTFLGLASMFWR
jgi:hypothetical protein